ncbi:MAG TPA: hypothetical protein VNK95_03945 [Caldilineaceae bacterium]|nr:hypothetical protein [Caldilineaceae bacterium]
MTKVPENSLNIPSIFPLLAAGVSSAIYALWLTGKEGRKWADEQTWATVVAGTAMTLAWYALEDSKAAKRAWLYFAVTGTPIVIRSLYLQLRRLDAVFSRAIDAE